MNLFMQRSALTLVSSSASSSKWEGSCATCVTSSSSSSLSTPASSTHRSESNEPSCSKCDRFDLGQTDQATRPVSIVASLLATSLAKKTSQGTATNSAMLFNLDEELGSLERSVMFKRTSLLEEADELIPNIDVPYKTSIGDIGIVSMYAQDLDETVLEQLVEYLEEIESMYIENGQSFEEATEAAVKVAKLLTLKPLEGSASSFFDPVTKFAMVLGVLVQSAGYNSQMCWDRNTEEYLAFAYRGHEIRTQLSADATWDLLMEDAFKDLRRAIYTTQTEFRRFRQLFLHSVLATDLSNREVLRQREERWARAFMEDADVGNCDRLNYTVVVELIIQKCVTRHTQRFCCCRLCMNELAVAQNVASRGSRDVFTILLEGICKSVLN